MLQLRVSFPTPASHRHFCFWCLRHSVIFSVLTAVLRVAEQSAATMTLAFAARRASLMTVSAVPVRGVSRSARFCAGKRRPSATGQQMCLRLASSSASGTTTAAAANAAKTEAQSAKEAQRRAYEHYRKKNEPAFPFNLFRGKRKAPSSSESSIHDRNAKIASYAAAVVIGALGATYASVPLYKVFCQATGFGGTTQRVTLSDWAQQQEEREAEGKTGRTGKISQALWSKLKEMSNVPAELLPSSPGASHGRAGPKTWTDEEAAARLAELKPVKDGRLITVRFDSTVGDVMPWEFVPTQLDVKVVPGETALSFFTATNNHPDKAITGVATYNVHPPRAGLYFNKIQCFCFEEQRLLPGETVDMPVFFFIDPEIVNDGQLARVNNITLSYTFFQTDLDDDDDDDDDDEDDDMDEKAQVGKGEANEKATGNTNGESQRNWTNKLAFWRR